MNQTEIVKGEIHTASYCAEGFIDNRGVLYCASTRRNKESGEYDTTFRFNPNGQNAPCNNYLDYQSRLTNLLRMAEVVMNPNLMRLDFKFDHADSKGDAEHWLKMWELMVYCFAVYKKIKPKGRMRTIDPFTGEHKSTKASSKSYEIEIYNKHIQKPDEGVDYRAEIRRKNVTKGDECDVLRQWERILNRLPTFYDEACKALSERMINEWGFVDSHFKLNQHLYTNGSMLFNREQIKGIYQALNCKASGQAASNFLKRYPVLLISKQELTDFCENVSNGIQSYLTGQSKGQIGQK